MNEHVTRGHCKSCGRRIHYNRGVTLREGTGDEILDEPVTCGGCHDSLYILHWNPKTHSNEFYGESNAYDLYENGQETRKVPRIHLNASSQSLGDKQSNYWFWRDREDARSRAAGQSNARWRAQQAEDQAAADRRMAETQAMIEHGEITHDPDSPYFNSGVEGEDYEVAPLNLGMAIRDSDPIGFLIKLGGAALLVFIILMYFHVI
jgi:hypothetical protein